MLVTIMALLTTRHTANYARLLQFNKLATANINILSQHNLQHTLIDQLNQFCFEQKLVYKRQKIFNFLQVYDCNYESRTPVMTDARYTTKCSSAFYVRITTSFN